MNKLLTLGVTAAALIAGAVPALAQGQTVVVLRNRPAAINPEPRAVTSAPAMRYRSPQYYANRSPRGYYGGYYGNGYDNIYNRAYSGGYGPYLRNGYVGGLKNIPHIVIQIPDNFSKVPNRISRPIYNHHGGGHSMSGGRPAGGGGRPMGGGRPAGGGGGARGGGGGGRG